MRRSVRRRHPALSFPLVCDGQGRYQKLDAKGFSLAGAILVGLSLLTDMTAQIKWDSESLSLNVLRVFGLSLNECGGLEYAALVLWSRPYSST